jgi:hypothetical protein
MIRALVTLALFATVGCVTRVPRTQVVVEIDAESSVLADATNIHVEVFGGARGAALTPQAEQDLGGSIPWPVTVALVPADADADRVFTVEGTATDASGATLGVVRARSSYVAGRTLTLRLTLEDCCRTIAATCDEDQTCRSCACVSAEVPPSSLPDWTADAGHVSSPDAPLTPDAGASDAPGDAPDAGGSDAGELDAAPDAGTDAGVVPDAAMPDAPDAFDPDTTCVSGTHCYRLVRTSMTWTAARSTCMGMGGDLVSIFGTAEQTTVWSIAAGMRVWTGGMNNGTSTWTWSDGSAWSSQWGPGEPNLPLAVWAYVNLVPGYGGLWGDDQSTVALPFVCEFP